ncbi:hypothetical protein SmJEL517_g00138 [Synchytrium microbalum]|uniref:2,4-dienoyl-CoA reductase [(3E)-enoyl-CoA-producing] n=1 Tax=Synchytrium microbalum TaxID=1806994 RepID=A0A507CKE5_9FUNG|nr:uncharacterized protein SmJEL517_g00138 [Synchytrium microbalum]TPX38303.1 hypothetical protein SmJEL517_g00138 [Synchytrium microbalum]
MPSTRDVFKDNLLENKVAFVVGGGSGICKGIARALAEHGCDIVICSRRQNLLEESASEIQAATGRKCIPIAADIRIYSQIESALNKAASLLGKIDFVIAGAAGNFLSPANKLSANGFKAVIDIDVNGTFNTCRAAFEHLEKSRGVIIALSGVNHRRVASNQVHGSAGKNGVDSIVKSCAVEWGEYGIRVNGIAPGPISNTEGMKRLAGNRPLGDSGLPLAHNGEILDIEYAAVFLCSEAARWITGATFIVDGGASLSGAGRIIPAAKL